MYQVPSEFSELNFTTRLDGIEAIVQYANYRLSIIRTTMSYGSEQGLYEIGVLGVNGYPMIELPGITDEGNTVKGFLTEDDVTNIMKKMKML